RRCFLRSWFYFLPLRLSTGALNMRFLFFVTGLILVFGLAFIVSNNKKGIHFRPILSMLAIQLLLGFLLMYTDAGVSVVSAIADGFSTLMAMANEGINFVFGGLVSEGENTFFITALLPIIFIAVLEATP